MRKRIERKQTAGFTLVELMIIVGIVCILIAIGSFIIIVGILGTKTARAVDRTMDSTQGPAVQRAATITAMQYAQTIENEPNPVIQCSDNASLFDHKVDCTMRLPSTNRVISLRCPYLGSGICTQCTHP